MNKGLLKSSRFFAGFFIGVISLVFFSATASHAAPTLDGITIQCNGDDSLNQTLNGGTIRFVLEMSHEITGVNIAGGTPYILLSRIKNLATGTDSSADEFRAYYAGAAQDGTELYFDYPIKAGDFSAGVDVKGTLELDGCVIHTSGGDVPSTIELMDASPYTECGYRIQISTFYFGSSGVQLKEVTVPEKKAKKGLTYYATIYSGALTTSDVPFDISVDYDGYEDIDFAVENQYGVGGTVNSLYGDTVSTYLSMTGGVMRLAITPKNVLYDEEIKIRIRPAGAGGDTSGDMFVVYPNGIEEDKAYIERIYVDSSADNRIYSCGEIIRINVDFSKKVSRVSGIPLLYLNVNNQNNAPNYQNNNLLRNYAVYNESRSSGNTVAFDYTVKAGDYIADLDAMDLDFNTMSGRFEFSDGSQFDWIVPHGDDIEGLASNSNISIQTIVFYDYCSTTASPEVREDYTLDLRVTRGAAVAGYAQHFTLSSDKANGDVITYPPAFSISAGAAMAPLPITAKWAGTQILRLHPYGYEGTNGDLVATVTVTPSATPPSVLLSSSMSSVYEGYDPFSVNVSLSKAPKEAIAVTVQSSNPESLAIVSAAGGSISGGKAVFTFPAGQAGPYAVVLNPFDGLGNGNDTVSLTATANKTYSSATQNVMVRNESPYAMFASVDDYGNWVETFFINGSEPSGSVSFQVYDVAADLNAGIAATMNWGDGTSTNFTCDATGYCAPVPHTYARPGTYRANLTLRDKDGGTETYMGQIRVVEPTQEEEVNGVVWTYRVISGEAVLGDGARAIPKGTTGAVSVPATLGGSPVTEIWYGAFDGCQDITSIAVPASVSSIECHVTGESFKNWFVDAGNSTYRDIDGVLFTRDGKTLLSYPTGRKGGYVVPDGTEVIESEAFSNSKISSIVIPDSVMELGECAFQDCRGLKSVTLSRNLSIIPCYAFYGCESLRSIDIPEGVVEICCDAFAFCDNLSTVKIPNSVESCEDPFNGCYQIKSVTLPGGDFLSLEYGDSFVYRFGLYDARNSITKLSIAEGATTLLNQFAFEELDNLVSLGIPASMTEVRWQNLMDVPNLRIIEIAEGNPAFAFREGVVFSKDFKTLICNLFATGAIFVVPEGVTEIASSAFLFCPASSIILPDSIKKVDTGAFMWCENLESLTFPRSVETIEWDYLFRRCDNLKTVFFLGPETRFYDDDNMPREFLDACYSLETVYFPASGYYNGGSWDGECPSYVISSMLDEWHSYEVVRFEPTQTISLDANGGSVDAPSIVRNYMDIYGDLPVPRRSGFAFNGWTLNGQKVSYSTTVESISNHVLVASWKESALPSVEAILETAISNAGFADASVKEAIGGDLAKYAEFQAWVQTVDGGEKAVINSDHAAVSWQLGADALFENEPEIRIASLALANAQGTGNGEQGTACAMTVTVEVKDGEDVVKVAEEKVAAMFEATSDLCDWTGAAKLSPTVSGATRNADNTMTFTVIPGDGTTKSAFLRIKVK
jgi:hypothetical protein